MTEKDWLELLIQGPRDDFLFPMRDWFLENHDEAGVAFCDWIKERSEQISQVRKRTDRPWVCPLGYPNQQELWWWRDEGREFDHECQNTLPADVFERIGVQSSHNPQKSRTFLTELDAWWGLLKAWQAARKDKPLGGAPDD